MTSPTKTAKVVLVTGSSAGIGRAVADRLDEHGWTVVGASRRGTSSGRWEGVVVDVDDERAVKDLVASVVERHGRLDAVVAAAGWGLAGAVEHTSLEEAKSQLETNFWGVVRVVQAALAPMREQGGGRIVIVGSLGGVIGLPFQGFYSASKFALEGLAEAMAYEVEPHGVSVTVVEPGNIATDFTASRRMTVASSVDDVYRNALDKAVSVMERDEKNGASAQSVAAVVEKVLGARRPARRVSVGKAGERVGLLAKRVMPYRLFYAAAKGSLGVD
jgi:NAD(P)-dependent dehydrogenase (short-subunit alcohol dehydrogenase family)